MSFLIKNENPLEGREGKPYDRLISLVPHRYACLRTWSALNGCCSQVSSPSSSPARKPKTSTSLRHLCICVHCYLKWDGSVAAIYPPNIPIRAGFSLPHSGSRSEDVNPCLRGKWAEWLWNGEEAIVERALTGGVVLCHSLDKVSAISLVVNTLFLSHLNLVIYHLPLFPSPFHCRCASVHPALLLLCVWPMCRVHYSPPRFITA